MHAPASHMSRAAERIRAAVLSRAGDSTFREHLYNTVITVASFRVEAPVQRELVGIVKDKDRFREVLNRTYLPSYVMIHALVTYKNAHVTSGPREPESRGAGEEEEGPPPPPEGPPPPPRPRAQPRSILGELLTGIPETPRAPPPSPVPRPRTMLEALRALAAETRRIELDRRGSVPCPCATQPDWPAELVRVVLRLEAHGMAVGGVLPVSPLSFHWQIPVNIITRVPGPLLRTALNRCFLLNTFLDYRPVSPQPTVADRSVEIRDALAAAIRTRDTDQLRAALIGYDAALHDGALCVREEDAPDSDAL